MKTNRAWIVAGMAVLFSVTGAFAQTTHYWWADPGAEGSRAGNGVWDPAVANWTTSNSAVPATAAGVGWVTLPSNGRAQFAETGTTTLAANFTFTGSGYIGTQGTNAVIKIESPKDGEGHYLYALSFTGSNYNSTGAVGDISTLGGTLIMDVPLTGPNLSIVGERQRQMTIQAPIFGETTNVEFRLRTTGSASAGHHHNLYLESNNTYGGSTWIRGAVLGSGEDATENRYIVHLSGSLANSNIEVRSLGTLQGKDADNKGLLHYNLSGNTADQITVFENGLLDLTYLNMSFNITGTQTDTEYVIADYSDGGDVIGTFASTSGLPSGWSIEYGGTTSNPDAIVMIIPEPGVLSLFGGALLILGLTRRFVQRR